MLLSDYAPAETVDGEVRWLRRGSGTAPDWVHTVPGLLMPACPGLGLVRLDGTWRVTHQPSGLLLAQLVDVDHARRVATALVALCEGWDRPVDEVIGDHAARHAWEQVQTMLPDGGRKP